MDSVCSLCWDFMQRICGLSGRFSSEFFTLKLPKSRLFTGAQITPQLILENKILNSTWSFESWEKADRILNWINVKFRTWKSVDYTHCLKDMKINFLYNFRKNSILYFHFNCSFLHSHPPFNSTNSLPPPGLEPGPPHTVAFSPLRSANQTCL